MAVRSRLARLGWTLPVAAAALAAAALSVPACGGTGATAGTAGTGGGTGGTGGGTGGSGVCASACSGATPVCDPDTKTCVGCLPSDDKCDAGKYCNSVKNTCESGCKGDGDCTAPQVCNTTSHQCANCNSDAQCSPGTVCNSAGQCVDGCSSSQPCSGGQACCDTKCLDLKNDVDACGACDKPCAKPANAAISCSNGICKMGACDAGFEDCNKNADDGCETMGSCACTPGATQDCYDGPPGTMGIGTCKGGKSTCDASGTEWGPCEGEQIPLADKCGNGLDEDCNGKPDDPPDLDGDGWGPCDGDCCETLGQCGNPNLVNPGAFEVPGNTIDDDCDGSVDNPVMDCDQNLVSNSADAMDYAKAIDLCQVTTENPALKDKKWGVISSKFSLTDGNGSPATNSKSIRQGFGSGVTPLSGSRIAVLSTGVAAAKTAPNNASPAFAAFQGGQDMGKSSPMPADWLTANANNLPNAPGCPDPQGGTTAHDPVMLKVRVRVPTNAKSFSVSTNFYSSEYPEWVCSAFNDFFVALLDSQFVPGAGQSANPKDKNLAFYATGNKTYPVGVNLAFGGTGLFTQCQTSATGCGSGSVPGNNTCMSTAQLIGTGFDDGNPPSQFPADPAYCSAAAKFAGGATGWLTTTGNVKPGETLELRLATWDTGDGWYDSVVLLDNWVWSVDASTPGTHQ